MIVQRPALLTKALIRPLTVRNSHPEYAAFETGTVGISQ